MGEFVPLPESTAWPGDDWTQLDTNQLAPPLLRTECLSCAAHNLEYKIIREMFNTNPPSLLSQVSSSSIFSSAKYCFAAVQQLWEFTVPKKGNNKKNLKRFPKSNKKNFNTVFLARTFLTKNVYFNLIWYNRETRLKSFHYLTLYCIFIFFVFILKDQSQAELSIKKKPPL